GSRVTISGVAGVEDPNAEHAVWNYQLHAGEGSFAAEEFKVPPVALEEWRASGRILPHRGAVELAEFRLRAGGADISLTGSLVAGAEPASTHIEGTFSPMSLNTVKALWPKAIAPGAREWVGERVDAASVLGGKFRFLSGDNAAPGLSMGAQEHQLSLLLDVADIETRVIDALPPIVAPHATVRIENDALEVVIPEAGIVLAPDRQLPLEAGRFTAVDIMNEVPTGEVVFSSQASLGAVMELIGRSRPAFLEETGLPREGIEGKVDAKFKIGMPLLADLPDGAVKIDGKARLTDGRVKQLLSAYQVQGASIDVDITEKAAGANGQMLINGVLAKLNWQRIFDAPMDKQPPLRLTATLDNTDRSQLGLDVNHIVQGVVPIELTVGRDAGDQPVIRLHGDLTNADLVFEAVGWRKPPGRSAALQCDIVSGKNGGTELQNFKVAGDDIAIEGKVSVGADNRMREFSFPDFSLNVVTRMELQGRLGNDDVWKVKVRGTTFDGRDFFRSLFSLGQLTEKPQPKPKNPREGIDVDAEIGTVIGHREVSVRGIKMKLQKRGDKLTALDVRGTIDGGQPIAVVLRQDPGQPRKLLADSTDAGQAFKLIDFYPNIQGGRVRLEVNLDGKGAAEKTGTLWVENFRILGDPVVSEVFSGADDGRPAIDGGSGRPRKRMVREVFDFTLMKVPFSVGYGQFVMSDSQLRGPMLGASIRGKVDYKMRRVNLGGTYVPLQGLSSALCEIPLFGQIITGPKCEGISGMTFAIQGSMDRPQVIVNPLSMLAPGIFRDIFQMTPFDPKVQRRDDDPPSGEPSTRASSTTIGTPADVGEPTVAPGTVMGGDTIDGWSSQTVSPPTRKR
ncbi:MAG: AsmA-like C-terminal region-containing protein, partial [Hyphomicrobium sp.]